MNVLKKLRALASLAGPLGPGWLLERLIYAVRVRAGLLRLQMPVGEWRGFALAPWLRDGIPSDPQAYARWRAEHAPAFFFRHAPALPQNPAWEPDSAVNEAEGILQGNLRFFAHTPTQVGFPLDWNLDPVSGLRLDARKHWSQIPDYGGYDIKFVWEASRFNQVYALLRAYAARPDERYPQAFWTLVEDWGRHNPPNRGPNWKCGQEASLRLLAWCFGLYGFSASPASTPQRVAQLTVMTAALARRVQRNLGYAISTRGNHAVTESFGLWLAGVLFPELREAAGWREQGRAELVRQVNLQVFPDGTYSMYSLNYQRFVLQVICCALRLGELNGDPFPDPVYRAVERSLDFFRAVVQPDGSVPSFGSNDGALVLQFNACDSTDYRPVLQLCAAALGRRVLPPGAWDEEVFWLYGEQALAFPAEPPRPAPDAFPDGGVFRLSGEQSRAVARCACHRERPSHADQLHVDLWWRGVHLAVDAETYLYNGQGRWINGLARSDVHNTVTVDGQDQMERISRFTWGRWTCGEVRDHTPRRWQASHDGYARLTDPVQHVRTLLSLPGDRWLVLDRMDSRGEHAYRLHWLLADLPARADEAAYRLTLDMNGSQAQVCLGVLKGQGDFSLVRADPASTRGWRAPYYGEKNPALSLALVAQGRQVDFWTYIGPADDSLSVEQDTLIIAGAADETLRAGLSSP